MIHKAGTHPPFIQRGMVLTRGVNRWFVRRIETHGPGNPPVAVLRCDGIGTQMVGCSLLRAEWTLAQDFDDGDDAPATEDAPHA